MVLEATIKISHEARDALLTLGQKGESYDAVIRRLIKHHEQSVKVSSETHQALITLGWNGESIDATIRRLCDMPEYDDFDKKSEE